MIFGKILRKIGKQFKKLNTKQTSNNTKVPLVRKKCKQIFKNI
jgi:hypothetical protein